MATEHYTAELQHTKTELQVGFQCDQPDCRDSNKEKGRWNEIQQLNYTKLSWRSFSAWWLMVQWHQSWPVKTAAIWKLLHLVPDLTQSRLHSHEHQYLSTYGLFVWVGHSRSLVQAQTLKIWWKMWNIFNVLQKVHSTIASNVLHTVAAYAIMVSYLYYVLHK